MSGECKWGIHKEPWLTGQAGTETIVEEWLLKRFEGLLTKVQREKKWDLSLVGPLVPLRSQR